jgi:hypothetical protein
MNESGFNFIGKNTQKPEVEKLATEILKTELAKATLEKRPNEVKKTGEEIETIKKIETDVNRELVDLGLKPDYQINPDQVHIVLTKSTSPFHFTAGRHNALKPGIVLNRENGQTLYVKLMCKIISLFRPVRTTADIKELEVPTLTHESVHDRSFHKYRVTEDKNSTTKVDDYRVGYHINADEPENVWFGGFNEAVTDRTMEDIINRDKDANEEKFQTRSKYKFNLEIVDKIAEKIAAVKGETKEEVWKRIKRGQFTGEMMHLRDIEKTFGPGSLRVLASMPTVVRKYHKKLFKTYFETDDEKVKKKIAKEILG